jgi:hypothetical protein
MSAEKWRIVEQEGVAITALDRESFGPFLERAQLLMRKMIATVHREQLY